MEKVFYVYEHWRPDRDECFYVGKGRGRRAWEMRGARNPHHANIVKKLTRLGLAVDVRIIKKDLSCDEALLFEIEQIAFRGRNNLANLTDGGDGLRNPSPETRARMSKAKIGNKINLGRRHSEETKKKIGALSKGRKPRLGAKLTEGQKARLRELGALNRDKFSQFSHLGPKASSKKVLCVSDGEEFPSASAAARNYGVPRSTVIELCLGRRHRKTVGGKVFKYVGGV